MRITKKNLLTIILYAVPALGAALLLWKDKDGSVEEQVVEDRKTAEVRAVVAAPFALSGWSR